LVLTALALIAGAVLALLGVRRLDPDARVVGKPAQLGGQGPIFALSHMLDEPYEATLLGRVVELQREPVESIVGDHLFWVGSSEGRRVPVLLLGEHMARQPEGRTDVRPGARVDVFGIVRRTNAEAMVQHDPLVDAEQARQITSAPFYISAFRVVVHR
jgi:hypothetical protein